MSRSSSNDAVTSGEEAIEEADKDIIDIEREGEFGEREAEVPEVLIKLSVFE